ncbi:caspase family protein [Mesorhizobium sp.]|uniref:caspase family protein n=1 Tax=Mesorhizobium sp. TaxID=1871066 RepID=UPI00121D4186|nr:caspase family protein [Mesorhizobium sp.]TIL43282.1 MAG: hypothetical protein E5Y86_22840 [Mesorhizobium sp.]
MTPGRTFALIIGVSANPRYPILGAPANDARALTAALTARERCALPACDVVDLINENATTTRIRAELLRISQEASERDRIFIYFAGHGERIEHDFGLIAWDTDPYGGVPPLRGSEFDELLAGTGASGLLLVIDCCYGANFAEHAPRLFRTAISGGYRVLLSSTRTDEKSWEIGEGGSTLFSKHLRLALEGAVPVGFVPGAIFLSDLARHIARNVDLDLRTVNPEYHQEQMFQGVYGKDPLLFRQARLTEHRLLLLLARYSLRDLLRFASISATSMIAIFSGLFAIHYSVLDRSRFVATAGTRIDLLIGRDGWNTYGFPKPFWQTDFFTDDVVEDSPLRADQGTVNAQVETSVLPVFRSQLSPVANLRWAYWNREFSAVRSGLKDLWSSQGSLIGAAWLLPKVMGSEDVPWLGEVAAETSDELTRANAWIAVAQVAPADTASGLLQARREPYTMPMELLSSLSPPCDDLKRSYVAGLLSKVPSEDYRSAAINAALRLGCHLSTDEMAMMLVSSFSLFGVEDVAGYIDTNHGAGEGDALLTMLPTFALADSERSDLPRKALAVVARSRRADCMPELTRQLKARDASTVAAAAAALLAHCPQDMVDRVKETAELNPELIALLAMRGGISVADVRSRLAAPDLDVFDAAYLLVALGAVGSQQDADEIVRFVGRRPDGEEGVRIAAVAALHRLRAPTRMAKPFLGGIFESSQLALDWVVDLDPAEARRLMRESMQADNGASFSRLARQLQLGPEDLAFLEQKLSEPSAESAAALLAQVQSPTKVAALLSSPVRAIRAGAARYAVANPLVSETLLTAIEAPIPGPVYQQLADDLAKRDSIRRILSETTAELRPWRAKLLYSTWRPQLSPGLKVILDLEKDKSPLAAYWAFRDELP